MLRLAVLSAPRQALVRGRGGSRCAARGHSGSQVLRRAPYVTGLASEGLKTAWFSNWPGGARKTRSQLKSSPTAVPLLRCESEGSVCTFRGVGSASARQPIALEMPSSQPGHHTPYTAHRITRRQKLSSKAQIYVAFARPKAACSADLAITSLSSGNWSAAASRRARRVSET